MPTITMKRIPVPVKLYALRDTVTMPKYATPGSMCFDLCWAPPERTPEEIEANPMDDRMIAIRRNEVTMVGTGWQFQLPEGFGLRLTPRSGLSTKFGLVLANTNGIIDQDYTGEVMLPLMLSPRVNFHGPFNIVPGERLVQAELVPIVQAQFLITRYPAKETKRGAGGFGSTGV